jgi:hypothetical protein
LYEKTLEHEKLKQEQEEILRKQKEQEELTRKF